MGITDFIIERDEQGEITGYTGRRKAVPDSVKNKIEPLHKTLLEIEQIKGEKASELYFSTYLDEEIKMNYEDYVVELMKTDEDLAKKIQEETEYKNSNTSITEEKNGERKVKNSFIRSLFFTVYE